MKVLITGVHGFVGSNLIMSLKYKHIIYGLDIVRTPMDGVINTFLWEDLDSILSVDIIIHLAGKAHDTKNKSLRQTYFDVNTGLTQRIYDYFLSSSAKKFIFFSSVKAAADFVVGDMLTEDIIPSPKGPYGESKIAAENYIISKPAIDKSVFILRPSMIHGSGNKGNLNLLYKIVTTGFPWPLGAFENKRSFTSIENLQFVVKGMVDKEVDSGIYNISDDEVLSTNDIIRLMADSLGQNPRIWNLPEKSIKLLARCGDVLKLPLNSERLGKLTESYVVSNKKIKEVLEIQKMPVSAIDGMKYTLNSFNVKNK